MKQICQRVLLSVKVITLFFALTLNAAKADEGNYVLAKINNKIITNLELADRYRFVLFSSKIKIKTPQDRSIILNQIIDKMIDEELIRQEAAKFKIEVTSDEMQATLESVAKQYKKNPTQFKIDLLQRDISFNNYLRQVEVELLWSKIVSEGLRSRVKITEVEVKEFFEQQKYDTSVKKFLIAQVFIPNSENSKMIADKLVVELRNGADFSNVVKQFSRDSLVTENNGEIGWVSQKEINAKLYVVISQLSRGGYSDAVQSAEGYYIFKLIDTKVETNIEEQDLAAARNIIFSRKLQSVAKGYLMELRRKAYIEVNRAVLR